MQQNAFSGIFTAAILSNSLDTQKCVGRRVLPVTAVLGSEETLWHGVFTDPGVFTAGQKRPARESESLVENRPDRGTSRKFFKRKRLFRG
jgi:hypothetical protein